MSKLTRYKKPPVIKLPRNLNVPHTTQNASSGTRTKVKPPKLTIFSDSSEDEDFMVLPSGNNKDAKSNRNGLSQNQPNNAITKNHTNNNSPCSSNLSKDKKISIRSNSITPSISEYFVPDATNSNNIKHSSFSKSPVNNDIPELDPILDEEESAASVENKVVCPFCWKRLNDKLTGTTHVKACAKNLPTNQIFEALQLQDKQIKEWERLGIAYPGFVGGGPSTAGGNGSRKPRTNRPPRQRKKKDDPELELAIALSESLNEEVQRRTKKENEFIISHGLEKEIELRKLLPDSSKTKIDALIPSSTATTSTTARLRKVKKGNLLDLPLYNSTESERKTSVEKKLNVILDENENHSREAEFSVREVIPVSSLKLSPGLKLLTASSKEPGTISSLWNLSSCEEPYKEINKSFVIPALMEIKEKELYRINCQQPENKSYPQIQFNDKIATDSSRDNSVPIAFMNNKGRIEKKPNGPWGNKYSERLQEKKHLQDSTSTPPCGNQLSKDLLRMYVSKEDSDLVVYGRDEKPIRCHKFIIKARCRLLLDEIAVEHTLVGFKKDVIPLTCYSHKAVKAFIKFLYCDQINLTSQLSKQDFEDLIELGEKYSVRIPKSPQPDEAEHEKSNMLQQSQDIDSAPAPFKNKCDRNRSNALHDISCKSIEMFSNGEDDLEISGILNKTNVSQGNQSKTIEETSSSKAGLDRNCVSSTRIAELDLKNCLEKEKSDSEGEGSIDLFDGYDDMEFELDLRTSEISTSSISSKETNTANIAASNNNGILEDELFSQLGSGSKILLSPKPYSHTKRSRSLSPIFSDRSYSASQMADLLERQCEMDSSNCISNMKQANKKHKLDVEMDYNEKTVEGNNDESVVLSEDITITIPSSVIRHRKKENINLVAITSDKVCSNQSSNLVMVTDFTNKSTEVKVLNNSISDNNASINFYTSTPLLSKNTNCPKSLPHPLQNDCSEDYDPFANDESCFLNVPSMLLANTSVPNNHQEESVNAVNPTINLNSARQPNLLNFMTATSLPNSDNIPDEGRNGRGQTTKSNKSAPKNISHSQPKPSKAIRNRNPCSSPPPTNKPTSDANGLNYSTIDTPLLKKELKRYGLKPLPRSKAKVLLRHIDQEMKK